jgi:hypothetical protein
MSWPRRVRTVTWPFPTAAVQIGHDGVRYLLLWHALEERFTISGSSTLTIERHTAGRGRPRVSREPTTGQPGAPATRRTGGAAASGSGAERAAAGRTQSRMSMPYTAKATRNDGIPAVM